MKFEEALAAMREGKKLRTPPTTNIYWLEGSSMWTENSLGSKWVVQAFAIWMILSEKWEVVK